MKVWNKNQIIFFNYLISIYVLNTFFVKVEPVPKIVNDF